MTQFEMTHSFFKLLFFVVPFTYWSKQGKERDVILIHNIILSRCSYLFLLSFSEMKFSH